MPDCAVKKRLSSNVCQLACIHSQLIGVNRSFDSTAFLSDGGDPLTLTSVTREMSIVYNT